ncbi:MAG: hypothetical protein ACREX6_00760 [Casimicrobiaceae bacterium]
MMSERKKLKMVVSTMETSPSSGASKATPDPEVRAVAKRRQFNAAYKLAVLEEADHCSSKPGAIGALLRREGLYSSHLTMWRREREAGALAALGRRRGRRATLTAEQKRLAALQAENGRLARELEQAHTIIEVQKKLCTLLGLPTAANGNNTGSES